MAVIRFIGDIHIGKRPSHSTRASAQRHKLKVDKVIAEVCDSKADLTIQLGDLFDSYQVTNNDLLRALPLINKVDMLVRGNHDFSHNSFNVSALDDLGKIRGPRATIVHQPQVFAYGKETPFYVHVVPYMPTQTEFIEALAKLKPEDGGVNILCLHTNMYAEGFNTSEVENNLSEEHAKSLCEVFDLVISGHEHNGCKKHGVYMSGCLFPMTFGDISDKYVLDFDTATKEVTPVPVWCKDGHYSTKDSVALTGAGYVRLDPVEFLAVPVNHGYDFIEIYGELQTTQILPLVKHMNVLLAESDVSSIKNGIKVIRENTNTEGSENSVSWEEFVEQSLTEEHFKIFQELRDE